jgi:hypothetical protein
MTSDVHRRGIATAPIDGAAGDTARNSSGAEQLYGLTDEARSASPGVICADAGLVTRSRSSARRGRCRRP